MCQSPCRPCKTSSFSSYAQVLTRPPILRSWGSVALLSYPPAFSPSTIHSMTASQAEHAWYIQAFKKTLTVLTCHDHAALCCRRLVKGTQMLQHCNGQGSSCKKGKFNFTRVSSNIRPVTGAWSRNTIECYRQNVYRQKKLKWSTTGEMLFHRRKHTFLQVAVPALTHACNQAQLQGCCLSS